MRRALVAIAVGWFGAMALSAPPANAQVTCPDYQFFQEIEPAAPSAPTRRRMAIDGNRAVVAYGTLSNGTAEIQEFDGTAWSPVQELIPSVAATGDAFGADVALQGSFAVVAAPWDGNFRGAVYVFRYDGTTWIEDQVLTASDGEDDDIFGSDVAIDGDWIAIGAHQTNDAGVDSGSVYFFQYDGTTWNEAQKVVSSTAIPGSDFGFSVDLEGDVMVTSSGDHNNFVGGAWVYRRVGTDWTEEGMLDFPPENNGHFGSSIAIDDGRIVVGYTGYDGAGQLDDSGCACLYEFDGLEWNLEELLVPPATSVGVNAGASIDILGGRIAIGAPLAPDPATQFVGMGYVYIFEEDVNGTWSTAQELVHPSPGPLALFGVDVHLAGNWLFINSQNGGSTISPLYLTAPCGGGPAPEFRRGDANGDGSVEVLSDAVFLLSSQFVIGSPGPPCADAADVNDDGVVFALTDAIYLLTYQFGFGPPPPAPGVGACAADPTPDVLGCLTPPSCP